MLKKPIFLMILILALVLILSISLGYQLIEKQKPSFLTVLSAESGSITNVNGQFFLTLNNPDQNCLFFSDRPKRISGKVSIESFLKDWAKTFKADPPNASLTYLKLAQNKTGTMLSVPVELINLQYLEGKWVFKIKRIGNNKKLVNQQLHDLTLFIDDIPEGVCYQSSSILM